MTAPHNQLPGRVTCARGPGHSLQVLRVLGFPEVLQVAEVGHEVRLVEHLLHGQVIEIGRIGEALHELRGSVWGAERGGGRTSSSSSKREKPP